MTRAIDAKTSKLRRRVIEKYLKSGHTPVGISGGKGSAVSAASRELKINRNSLNSWVDVQRLASENGELHYCPNWELYQELKPGEKLSKDGKRVPMSEDERKFHGNWTKEDCISELRRIAEEQPDNVISRNHFRVHSVISESTWNRFFGTFHEFKRQANIVLSRHQHRLEKSIAKHASTDAMKAMTIEKRGYEDKYLKPTGGRFQDILTATDIHDEDCDPFYRRVLLDTAARLQPEVICLNGDIFDLPEFSNFTKDPRDWNPVRRIKWVHTFLRELREACPDAEIIFIEGNHEFRLLRHLSESTPALKQVLHELHGFTVSSLLGLDEFELNFIAKADLSAFREKDIKDELRRNYYVFFDAVLAHHFPEGKNMGFPGWNGHHHKHITTPFYSPIFGSTEWHQVGCGSRRNASFCNGEIWSNGFLITHVDTQRKHSAFEYVEVKEDFAIVGGRWYERGVEERIAK